MATISADSKPVPAESIIKKPSTTQQQKECEKYLTSHQISTVINQLATSVLFSKPDNPREFMIKKLEEMRGLKVYALPSSINVINIIHTKKGSQSKANYILSRQSKRLI